MNYKQTTILFTMNPFNVFVQKLIITLIVCGLIVVIGNNQNNAYIVMIGQGLFVGLFLASIASYDLLSLHRNTVSYIIRMSSVIALSIPLSGFFENLIHPMFIGIDGVMPEWIGLSILLISFSLQSLFDIVYHKEVTKE